MFNEVCKMWYLSWLSSTPTKKTKRGKIFFVNLRIFISFSGDLTLDLNRFPRGAKSAKLCTLDMLKTDGSVPQMSLFKQKRVKAWWPFVVKNDDGEYELTVSMEVHVCHY